MRRTALILMITMGALVAATTASSQVIWQHPSKTEWFHKADLRIEHRIEWTFSGTSSCYLRGTHVPIPVKGQGTAVFRVKPAPSWPNVWRLEKSDNQGYRGVFGGPGLYPVANLDVRGGIVVRRTREESGQLTADRSACGEPSDPVQVEPFDAACTDRARQGMNVSYSQRIRHERRLHTTVPDRGREHRRMMYVDDPEVVGSESIDAWQRACLVETKHPFATVPWRAAKSMTFSWSQRKSGRIEDAGSGTYAWTSKTTVQFGLGACRAKYSRGSWPEFKGCR